MDLVYPSPLWTIESLSAAAARALLAAALAHKRSGAATLPLRGRHVALMCAAPDSAPALLFGESAAALGASLSVIQPQAARVDDPWQGGAAARMLGRLYDAICCDAGNAGALARLARESAVPVLTLPAGARHPTTLLADLMTMQEAAPLPLESLRLCLVDDESSPIAAAWRHLSRVTGLQVCVCATRRARAEVDFVCDAAGPRCPDGRLALLTTRREVWLAEAQMANHPYTMRALLAGTLH